MVEFADWQLAALLMVAVVVEVGDDQALNEPHQGGIFRHLLPSSNRAPQAEAPIAKFVVVAWNPSLNLKVFRSWQNAVGVTGLFQGEREREGFRLAIEDCLRTFFGSRSGYPVF